MSKPLTTKAGKPVQRPGALGSNRNPKGSPQNMIPGAGQKKAAAKSGRFSEEMRAKMRPILEKSLVLLERILEGKSPTKGNPDPTANEIINAFKVVAPYVMTELKPVMDKRLCEIVAEELASDPRIPKEAITDVIDRMLYRLNDE